MAKHHSKDETEFAWLETKARVMQEGRFILNRLLDVVLDDLCTDFNAAINEGRIVDIQIDRAELKRRLAATAKKELGSGR